MHCSIAFEKIPSDYTTLKDTHTPPTGGDTLWCSGYEMYDRVSPSLRSYLETLTAKFHWQHKITFHTESSDIITTERGAPENIGDGFTSYHPVVRTNPLTGWKSLFGLAHHASHIENVSQIESAMFLDYFHKIIVENHDLQVRYKWNPNDVAIVGLYSIRDCQPLLTV